MDCDGLSSAQLSRKALDIIQSSIYNRFCFCFPENNITKVGNSYTHHIGNQFRGGLDPHSVAKWKVIANHTASCEKRYS